MTRKTGFFTPTDHLMNWKAYNHQRPVLLWQMISAYHVGLEAKETQKERGLRK